MKKSTAAGLRLGMVTAWFVAAGPIAAAAGFDIVAAGAVGDGVRNNTAEIQATIDRCAGRGGGSVEVPAGRFVTGTIRLHSGVTLNLRQDAVLVGSQNLDDYLGFRSDDYPGGRWNRGLIVVEDCDGVAVTGPGIVDADRPFDPRGEGKMRGPHTILMAGSDNVRLQDLQIDDSGNYAVLMYQCRDVLVDRVAVRGGWDGVHFRGDAEHWNERLTIRGCNFQTGDDCIAGHYVRDGVIDDCYVNSSCNGLRLIGPAERLTIQNCRFEGPGNYEHLTVENLHRTNMLAGILLQPSAWTPTPGPMNEVTIRDCTMNNVSVAVAAIIRGDNTAKGLVVERLEANRVYGPAMSIESWADVPFEDAKLNQVKIYHTPGAVIDPRLGRAPVAADPVRMPGVGVWNRALPAWGLYARNLTGLSVDELTFKTSDDDESRPAVELVDVDNVTGLPLQAD